MTGMLGERKEQLAVGLAIVLVVWGAVGLLLRGPAGRGGYSTGLGAVISNVEEGGPAEGAGLMVGDRIVRVGDRPVTHPWARPDRDRVGAGNAQSLAVERGGERSDVEVAWQGLSRTHWTSIFVEFLVTFAFLGFGIWAFLASGTSAGLLLALLGLCYAGANFGGPTIGFLDPAIRFIGFNLSFLTTVLLVHFFLVFPKRKKVFGHRVPVWLIYLLFMPFFLFGLVEVVAFPAFLSEYRRVLSYTDLLLMVLALAALLHTWITLGREELRRTRFHVVLWGLALSFGPILAFGLLGLAFPGFTLPGSEYLPLLGVVIPGSMAVAVVAGARAAGLPSPAGHRRSELCEDVLSRQE